MTAIIYGASQTAKEVKNLAAVANASTEEMQRNGHAARTVGVETEKLADIYKDVNDKIGEFLNTGGGEMKDFFENIAPRVGLTAQAFRGLSGPQALQLYYNALQKANLSQAETTFYMEAIADEATALIPLLRDNGAEMKRLGASAAVLDQKQIDALNRFNAALDAMKAAFANVLVALVDSGFIDNLTQVVTRLGDFAKNLAANHPWLVQFGVAMTAIAAAIGPVLIIIGQMVIAISALLPLFATAGAEAGVAAGLEVETRYSIAGGN